ncbi:hypothetical protein ACFOY2_11490 [Nonomuraea purpurea]|uniref:Uncharacterized protein n=1 Tax=Nonomuraea purpurea TaxID=1849276 RepID=A0ABV8G1H7_9ACTN
MYKQGLVLAGIVGGLLMSGVAANAATTNWPRPSEDHDRKLLICGDENILANGEVNNSHSAVINVETGDILSQILGIKSKENKCSVT